MSKKTSNKDTGDVHFDSNTNTVTAASSKASDNAIREKVSAVKDVIKSVSNDKIALVLQYYNNNVQETINAFLTDNGEFALSEWNTQGEKTKNKRKSKKNSPANNNNNSKQIQDFKSSTTSPLPKNEGSKGGKKPAPPGNKDDNYIIPVKSDELLTNVPSDVNHHSPIVNNSKNESKSTQNGPQQANKNRAGSKSSTSPASQPIPNGTSPGNQGSDNVTPPQGNYRPANKGATLPRQPSSSSISTESSHSLGKIGLDRTLKDLSRTNTSLTRIGNLLNQEMEHSEKRIGDYFKELRLAIDLREKELQEGLQKTKKDAYDLYKSRQDYGQELKMLGARAETLSEEDASKLRLEIKHFVSDRKYDEDLCKTIRFQWDNKLLEEIKKFGEIVPVNNYMANRRLSQSSIASSSAAYTTGASSPVEMLSETPPEPEMNPIIDRLNNLPESDQPFSNHVESNNVDNHHNDGPTYSYPPRGFGGRTRSFRAGGGRGGSFPPRGYRGSWRGPPRGPRGARFNEGRGRGGINNGPNLEH